MKFCCSIILLVLTGLLLACSTKQKQVSYEEGIQIVPQPNKMVEKTGSYTLNEKTQFVVSDPSLKDVVGYFSHKIGMATGFKISQVEKGKGISIVLLPDSEIKEEAYDLMVNSSGVNITAKTPRGAFYAMQTLMQLLPSQIESTTKVKGVDWEIPSVEIQDAPRFPYRGMHLDVCRHFYSVEFIKKQIDVMAMFKMNMFHWHLTEDQAWRIEIKKYPKLIELGSVRTEGEGNEYGGFYTQEQVKEVVKYAQERFVTVIPEIELPGHALAALVGYPEFSCTGGPFTVRNIWGVEPDVYCAGKEATFAFLNDVIDEVVALFPSEYFHIGGDECPKKRWEECPLCQKRMKIEGLKNEHELQSYFIKRVEKMLTKHGKKMIGWDEILEGGLAPSATVMSWRGEKGGIEAAEQGHDVVMTPGNWCYLDHYQGSSKVEPVAIGGYTNLEESYSYDPVPEKLDAEKAKHILGTQGNVWSEYMYTGEIVEHRVYPRIIALAEVGWTVKEAKNFNNFVDRLNNQWRRLDQHGINYHIPQPEGPANKVVFSENAALEFTTTRPMKMVYTTDGTEPKATSKQYEQALTFTETSQLKIRTVLPTGQLGDLRTITVQKQDPIQAVEAKTKANGLKMKVAEGHFITVLDMDKAVDWKEVKVDSLKNVHKLFDYKKTSAGVLTGYVEIPETGIYQFSSDMDQLFIADQLLINNDGDVKRFSRNDAMISLEKGLHPIKIVYLNNIIGGWPQNWNSLKISFKKEGDKKYQVLNTSQCFY